ncbi:MAG TPA: GNAT family N-acetyltransferase [Anaerolineae bacterium]|nr:GNAT family N-acetyltransferase [Anaerolineae bacterium]
MMMVEIRKIREEERAEYLEVGRYVFNNWTNEPPDEEWVEGVDVDCAFGLFVEGKLAARMYNRSYKQFVRGVLRPMGGLAGVGTYPEHRGKGYARELLTAVLADMRDKGQAVGSLHPFRESFYGKYDYVVTPPRGKARFPLVVWRDQAAEWQEETEWRVTRAPAVDCLPLWTEFVADVGAGIYHGYVYYPEQPATVWARETKDELMGMVWRGDELMGMVRYKTNGFMADGVLTISEMHWRGKAGREKLFGFLGMHAEAIQTVEWKDVSMMSPFTQWFGQPRIPAGFEIRDHPLMVRLTLVAEALTGLPAVMAGECYFDLVEDMYCPWNVGRYRVWAEGGRLKAEQAPLPPVAERGGVMGVTAKGVAALVYGTMSLAELEYREWVWQIDDETGLLLHNWLPERVVYNPVFF